MEHSSQSSLLLRFCECKSGEIAEGATTQFGAPGIPVQVPLGNALMAKWDPTHPNRIGVLYTSGTLRLWDVLTDSRRDFALYIPTAGVPHCEDDSHPEKCRVSDRRLAMPITHFDFVPLSLGKRDKHGQLPRIAFTVRRSRMLHIADIPLQRVCTSDTALESDHYISGSRVYESSCCLPSEPTTMCSWLMCLKPTAVAAIAVGCADGSISAWALSGAFNPDTVVSMRSQREASPAMLRAVHLSPGTSVPSHAAALPDEPVHTSATAHSGRVKVLQPLMFLSPRHANTTHLRGSAPHWWHNLTGHTLLCSSGDDGLIRTWRLSLLSRAKDRAAASASFLLQQPQGQEPPVALTLCRFLEIPSEGAKVTAFASAEWPIAETSTASAVSAAAPFLGPVGTQRGLGASMSRCIIATGNVEGVVSVWELMVPETDLHLDKEIAAPLVEPSVRLVGSLSCSSGEPVGALALAGPTVEASYHSLVVAGVDGSVSVYKLEGKLHPEGGQVDEAFHGSHGPLMMQFVGEAAPGETDSIADVVSGLQPHALASAAMCSKGRDDDSCSDGFSTISSATLTSRVVSALTARAVQRLRQSIVSCSFNDASRWHGSANSSTAEGALMACNGAGQVMLWRREQLPGSVHGPMLAASDDLCDQVDSGATVLPIPPLQSSNEPVFPTPDQARYEVSPKMQSNLDVLGSPAVVQQQLSQMEHSHTHDTDSLEAAQEPPDQTPLQSCHASPVSPTNAREPMRASRVLHDTESRRRYVACVAESDAAEMPARRSVSPLAVQSRAYYRQAAGDAVRSAFLTSCEAESGRKLELNHAQHMSSQHMRAKSPVDRWQTRTAASAARFYGIEPEEMVVTSGAVSLGTGGTHVAAELAMRNPAKVAASLVRDARETVRAAAISAGTPTGVDSHVDATGTFDRIAARGVENHHHLVAPGVGSSSAIADAIAALECLQFDESSALLEIVQHRKIEDKTIIEEVVIRLRQPGNVAEQPASAIVERPHEEEFAYVPDVRSAHAPSEIVIERSMSSRQSLLRPTKSSLQRAQSKENGDRVSSSDVLRWHGDLRTSMLQPGAASTRRRKTNTQAGNTPIAPLTAPWGAAEFLSTHRE